MLGRSIALGCQYNGPKILLTIPNTGDLNRELAMWLLEVQQVEAHNCRVNGRIFFPMDRPYEQNQNAIALFFEEEQYDFWISIDADNPPRKNIIDLVFLNKDMIGCPTPVWKYVKGRGERPIMWNAYDYLQDQDAYAEHSPKEGLQKVDAVGTGCFVIHQRCFPTCPRGEGPFDRIKDSKGLVYKGNDISFCERLQQNGFEIYAHYDYPCNHFNTVNLIDVASAFGELNA